VKMTRTRSTRSTVVHDVNHIKSEGTGTESALLELFAASTRAGRLLRTAMARAPLRPDEFAIYSLLRVKRSLTPSELARALGMQRSTLSNYLTRMNERGDLLRQADGGDRRSVRLALSPRGQARDKAAMPYFSHAVVPLNAALGAARPEIIRALRQLSVALDSATEQSGRDRRRRA